MTAARLLLWITAALLLQVGVGVGVVLWRRLQHRPTAPRFPGHPRRPIPPGCSLLAPAPRGLSAPEPPVPELEAALRSAVQVEALGVRVLPFVVPRVAASLVRAAWQANCKEGVTR